jgi:hypothetical protein
MYSDIGLVCMTLIVLVVCCMHQIDIKFLVYQCMYSPKVQKKMYEYISEM